MRYVPKLTANFLSVHAITESGGKVLFNKNNVTVNCGNKTIVKDHKMKNGLFQVNLKPVTKEKSLLTERQDKAATTWHRKLGYISERNLQTLQTMYDGIELTKADIKKLDKVCSV